MKFYTLNIWLKMCNQQNKKYVIVFTIIMLLSIFNFCQPIAFANTITYINIQNYQLSVLWVLINLGVVTICVFLSAIKHSLMSNICTDTYKILNQDFITAILKNDLGKLSVSNEELANISNEDIENLSLFSLNVSELFTNIFKVLIILIFVSIYSLLSALILLIIAIVNYMLLKVVNKKQEKCQKEIYDSKIRVMEKFSDMATNKSYIKKLEIDAPMTMEYDLRVDGLIRKIKNKENINSIKDNWLYLLFNAITSVISLILIYQLFHDQFSLLVFLIIIPYVSTFVLSTSGISKFFQEKSLFHNSYQRYYKIVNYSKKEKFEDTKNFKILKIIQNKTVVANIKNKGIFLFKYNDLNQAILKTILEPSYGVYSNISFYINDNNIKNTYDFLLEPQLKLQFFDDTIYKNLIIFVKKKKNLYKMLNTLNIYTEIKNLSNGIKTNINRTKENISEYCAFCLNIIVAFFSKKQIILIKNLNFNKLEIVKISDFISQYGTNKIVLVFEGVQQINIINSKIIN